MRRHQKLLIIPSIIVIAISIFSGFKSPSAEKEAINLLKERTTILQAAFYQQMTQADAEKRLAEIETYPLLTDDIKSIREWEATQLDIVKSMNFISFEQEKNFLNYMTYRAVIYWDMSGLSENYTMCGNYYVVLKKENNGFKLSVFNPIVE